MGEFSAGKSTLANLLIGAPVLPVQVTATQLPPVWIRAGSKDPLLVDMDGNSRSIDLANIADLDIEATRYIRVSREADLLGYCDIIDLPGISDPNMSPEVWQRVLHHADAIVWCSHATQAWRQSEAAVWDTIPQQLQSRSLLLLTRFDKLTNELDRERVLRRVRKEAAGKFRGIYPVSLLDAIRADDDREKWIASGAEDFVGAFVTLLHELGAMLGTNFDAPVEPNAEQSEVSLRIAKAVSGTGESAPARHESAVMPRRVAPSSTGSRPRPGATARPQAPSKGT